MRKSAIGGRYPPPMRTTWTVAGLLLALSGLIWLLQGFNVAFAPKSFMTGDPLWVVLGAVALLAGVALAAAQRRRT